VLQHVHKKEKKTGWWVNELHEKKISVAFFMVCKREAKLLLYLGVVVNESGSVVEET
jgi:hypothetical protein